MRQTLRDLASLAARLGVGGIFFANGWHKLEAGLNATAEQFTSLGASGPYVWAATTMLTELIGGALLVAGLAVPACGLLLFAEALAVFVLASGETGLPLTGGDAKLIVALGAASILLAVGGAGRLSVDHMVVIKRREAEAAEDFAAEAEADDVIAALREPETHAAPAPARPAAGKKPGESAPERLTPEGPTSEGVTSEGVTDTAEFPAATRPRTRTRKPPSGAATSVPPATPTTAPTPVGTPVPGKTADTLVAGKKDKPSPGS
ncbi:DoxX family protein [Streptosporangium sp. NBC_01469]|uniref:DoxX family protein n=1 Tax=Streptosporangium sp. NBC_01469 TaxID=2903898 RepID=UPI002E2CFF46|nr:DoxX family protein [Streptosporangium sp. NBC_01469]